MNPNQPLTGNQTFVSADETFDIGFFSPQNSQKQYLGIWFKKPYPTTVVWVANREVPLPKNSTCSLKLIDHGVLVILGNNNTPIWSSNTSRSVKNPVAQLLSTGNLVVRNKNDPDPENFLWQTFDYPSDTVILGMKVGRVRGTGPENADKEAL